MVGSWSIGEKLRIISTLYNPAGVAVRIYHGVHEIISTRDLLLIHHIVGIGNSLNKLPRYVGSYRLSGDAGGIRKISRIKGALSSQLRNHHTPPARILSNKRA